MGSRFGATTTCTSLAAFYNARPSHSSISRFQGPSRLHRHRRRASNQAWLAMTTPSRAFLSELAELKRALPPPAPARRGYEGDSYFCHVCLNRFQLDRPIIEHYEKGVQLAHHRNVDSLKKAAGAGCWFCERLWHRWKVHRSDAERNSFCSWVYVRWRKDEILAFNFSCDSFSPVRLTFEIDLERGESQLPRRCDKSEYARTKESSVQLSVPSGLCTTYL